MPETAGRKIATQTKGGESYCFQNDADSDCQVHDAHRGRPTDIFSVQQVRLI